MSLSQVTSGRAFEYGIAISFSKFLNASILDNSQIRLAELSFGLCTSQEQSKIVRAADEISLFLIAHDNRLIETQCSISLQSDQTGKNGDVRDILIHNNITHEDVGISAKNRHYAVKHSRLSDKIDFGKEWFGVNCSEKYFSTVVPIFNELRLKQREGLQWKNIANKKQIYYDPILEIFQEEMLELFNNHTIVVAGGLLKYLLGRYDFYKIIKENGDVSAISFNLNNTLKWGSRLPLPTRIIEISRKPTSQTTIIMTFDNGWQLSFRIHNASTLVEPSLKFDINIIGLPSSVSRNVIKY
ncbi:MAG: HaeIII family restriction endonuclease [Bacteroidetes bacterium]|nr:HaeIII family restriction endonuclease [Bacteroidota bacterium]